MKIIKQEQLKISTHVPTAHESIDLGPVGCFRCTAKTTAKTFAGEEKFNDNTIYRT